MDAKARHGHARPEAILPAYGCPDLVAACEHAGVSARLVDVAEDQWGFDLPQLESAISEQTVALVAVNLLGVGDQSRALAPLAGRHGVSLIQDSAQHLPVPARGAIRGDYAVFSFGRGKPLNMLGGGALLSRGQAEIREGAMRDVEPVDALSFAKAAGSAIAFNLLTAPAVFGVSRRLLRSRLGITRYKPVSADLVFNAAFRGALDGEFERYQLDPGYDSAVWQELFAATAGRLRALTDPSDEPPSGHRLRLAVLTESRLQRDEIVGALDSKGLGATSMYGLSMNSLPGIPAAVAAQGPFPNAERLADRLLTLPTHSGVTARVVRTTIAIIRACLGMT
jgi:dTDP-4-amino-4,6-dideoxygalactose transaminase